MFNDAMAFRVAAAYWVGRLYGKLGVCPVDHDDVTLVGATLRQGWWEEEWARATERDAAWCD